MKKRVLFLVIVIIGIIASITISIVYTEKIPNDKEINRELAIDEDHFPNMWVRNEVSLQVDKDSNGILSEKEMNSVSSLSLPIGDRDTIIQCDQLNQLKNVKKLLVVLNGKGKKVKLEGLENITEIEIRVYAEGSSVVELSEMNNLSFVRISSKNEKCRTAFSLHDCAKAEQIEVVNGDGICQFELYNLLSMQKIEMDEAAVTKLDFRDLPALKSLSLYSLNKLSRIALYKLSKLENVEFRQLDAINQIELYDLPNIKEFSILYAKKLHNIDFNSIPSMKKLTLYEVPLKKINLSLCRQMSEIQADSVNTIRNLDLTAQSELKSFEWNQGALKEILWGEKKKLEKIVVNDNKLSGTFNLSKFPQLQNLEIKNNMYDKLLGKRHKRINYIKCDNNQLKLIDLGYANDICWIQGTGNRNVTVYLPQKRMEEGEFAYYDFVPEEDIGPNSTIYYR